MSTHTEIQGDGAIRRTSLLGYTIENTYAGVLSFARRNYQHAPEGADIVISGVPLDLATTNRPGARLGPAAIRAASVQMAEDMAYPWGFNPFEELAVADAGDCYFDPHQPHTIHNSIVEHARRILATGARMLTLGGDHYITYPLLQAHVERIGQPLSLIHFDAHCDTWADDTPGTLNHGTMFYKAVKDGLIDPEHSVQIGIRTWNEDFMGIPILDAQWVHRHGSDAVVEKIRQIVGQRPAYLTFDIDCLDPAFAPGTGTPVCGGLSTEQALAIVRQLGDINMVGMDVVEVSAPYDHAGITALAAASLAFELLCLARNRKVGATGNATPSLAQV